MDLPTPQNARLPTARTVFQALQEQHQLQSEHIHEVVGWLVSAIFFWGTYRLMRSEGRLPPVSSIHDLGSRASSPD
jgi:hypothetical protein